MEMPMSEQTGTKSENFVSVRIRSINESLEALTRLESELRERLKDVTLRNTRPFCDETEDSKENDVCELERQLGWTQGKALDIVSCTRNCWLISNCKCEQCGH